MTGLMAIGLFLYSTFFSLLTLVLWLRIFSRYFRVPATNDVYTLAHTLTTPLVRPAQHLFSKKIMYATRYDWPCLLVLLLVELLRLSVLNLLLMGGEMPLASLGLHLLGNLVYQPCQLLFYAILLHVILSWVKPMWQHPVADFLKYVTTPLLNIGSRIIPNVSGFDFSPIAVMVLLKMIMLFVNTSLLQTTGVGL